MSSQQSTLVKAALAGSLVAIALIIALGLWRRAESRERAARRASYSVPEPRATQKADAVRAPDPTPLAPAPVASREPNEHVHEEPEPLADEQHTKARETKLISAMKDMVELKEGAALRVVVENYRREFPNDPNKLGLGYSIISDCLEHPGVPSRTAALRYYQTEKASPVRSDVRTHCLEGAE